jgi:predicted TIM-barrel fold metal-dependent hydrolase
MADYQLISADSHVIEPHDLWLRYIDRKYLDRAPRLVHEKDTDRMVVEEADLGPVGLLAGCKRGDDEVRVNGRWDEDVFEGGYNPHVRMEDLATDGVDAEVLFPTVGMWMYLISDDGFRRALFSAYNSWLAEFCGAYPHALKGLAMLDPDDVDAAVAEAKRASKLGFVGVILPLYAPDDAPYYDSRFDQLWATLSELRLPINMHSSTSRTKDGFWKSGPSFTFRLLRQPAHVQEVLLEMIFRGVFDRHPDLKVVSAENDLGWASYMLERADYWWHRNLKLVPSEEVVCEQQPSHYFHSNILGTFMRDRTAILTSEVIGAHTLMWGNDFPHHVSTWPHSRKVIDEYFTGVPDSLRRMVVCDNARALYGF